MWRPWKEGLFTHKLMAETLICLSLIPQPSKGLPTQIHFWLVSPIAKSCRRFSVASLAFRLCRICSVSSYVKLPRIVVGDSLFVTEAGYRALKTERDRVTCLAPTLDYSGKRVFNLLPHIPRSTVFRWTAQLCDGKELKPRRRSHWVMKPLFARGGRVWGAP